MPDLSKISTEELLAMRDQAAAAPPAQDLAEIPTDRLLKMRDQALNRERPKTSLGGSVMRGAAQGASLGFADELTAGVGAVKDWASGELGMRGPVSIQDAYGTYINRIRAKDEAARADNPKAFTAGAIAGGVGSAIATGGVANTLKGATALGAVTGAGTSEANPFESPSKLKEFALDTAKGAGIGLVTGGAANLGGKALSALKPSNLTKTANIKTLKAAGYTGKELKKLSESQKQEIGQTLYDKGIVKLGDSLEDILGKASSAKEQSGQAIGKALDGVDDLVKDAKAAIDAGKIGGNLPPAGKEALKKAVDKQFQFNMGRIGQRIEKEIIAPNAKNPLLKGEMTKLAGIADDFKAGGSLSMREGNVIKGTQGKVTNFNSETVPQSFRREVYDIIKTEIDDIVAKTGNLEQAVAKGSGNTIGKSADTAARNNSVLADFAKAKKDYSAAARTTDVASERLGQLQANREISLTDTIAAVGGLATGNPANAIVLGGLNKLARQYGDGAIASTARVAAKIISKTPEKLGKFGAVLEQAAKKGGPALDATHLALLKDPDYRRILADYENSDNPMKRRLGE